MSAFPPDPGFQPISPNPYIVGNPVRNPAMFFGRESEFELVRKRFTDTAHGSLMVFCGERRSGKTSILLQIQQGRLGREFIPVLIDMQAMAVESETEFLSRIAQEIIEQLGEESLDIKLPDFARGKPAAVFRGFIESILSRHSNRKLLLLFDEYELFEDKLNSGVLTNDVLLILSNLMENLPTFVVFTGSQHLEERRNEYWRILEKTHVYRRISYLQTADAVRLIQEPVAGRVTYADATVERIMRLTAGHPFYTQAVCQNLVDALNEDRTNTVTEKLLAAVVEMIVENPFPQMTFLWDTLERDQKLTLALLAEVLEHEKGYARAKQLVRAVKKGNYPLRMSRPAVSTALETLFKNELLSKDDARVPGYAFRMDLWRLWIRRMHSVWQVMREEGLEFRGAPTHRTRTVATAAAGLVVLSAVVWQWHRSGTRAVDTQADGSGAHEVSPTATSFVRIVPQPGDAHIELDGTAVAVGRFESRVPSDREYRFNVRAPGYVDSIFVRHVVQGDCLTVRVPLRPRRGGLQIETDPPSAGIWLDGQRIGTGMAERADLLVPVEHVVEARLENYRPIGRSVQIVPETTTVVSIVLQPMTVDLTIVTVPDSAEIRVDGQQRGVSPLTVSALGFGSHHFRVEMAGYLSRDTTLVVDRATKPLLLRLASVPLAVLLVRGDRPARIYVDERQVGSGELLNSGEVQVASGSRTIEVAFRDGTKDTITVDVSPGERVELLWEEQKLRVLHGGR